MRKSKHCPSNCIQLTRGAHVWLETYNWKNLCITFGHVLMCPLCLKEQAPGFLLLLTAGKLLLQTNSVTCFSAIWSVANSCVLFQPVQQILSVCTCSDCPKTVWRLCCSTSTIAVSSCSSCHLNPPLCIFFSNLWFQNLKWSFCWVHTCLCYFSISLFFNTLFQTLQSILETTSSRVLAK